MSRIDSVYPRLQEHIAKYFPHLHGQPVIFRAAPIRAGSNTTYRVELHSAVTDRTPLAEVIVKFNPPHKPQQIEFDHLKLLFEHRTPSLMVPRPLDYFPDLNALVTAKVGGEQLSKLILQHLHLLAGRQRRDWIASRLQLSGQWLANYHRLTQRSPAPPFTQEWVQASYALLDKLELAGFPRSALAAARDVFHRLHEFGKAQLTPYAERHGDYGLYNIHATNEGVCVFDFNDRRPECIYEDVSFVGVTLETMNAWPRHPLFARRAAIAMRKHFLIGYFGTIERCCATLLEGYALRHFLRLCLRQRQRLARRQGAWLIVFDALRMRGFYRRRVLAQCELIHRLLSSSPNLRPGPRM